MNNKVARASEVLELYTEVSKEAEAMFEAAKSSQREAARSLKRLRLFNSHRAAKEAYNRRLEAFRALRRSEELFQAGQVDLKDAKALWKGLKEEV